MDNELYEERTLKQELTLPPSTQLKVFGAVMVPALAGDLLAHGGLPGAVLGGVGAYLFAKNSPELYTLARQLFPVTDLTASMVQHKQGSRSIMDRLMGRYPAVLETEEVGQELSHTLTSSNFNLTGPTNEVEFDIAQKSPQKMPTGKYLLHLAPDLIIPAADIAGKAIFIAGVRRSGKTTLGVRIAEQMSKHRQPLFVPDLEGDWISAAITTFSNGKILAHPSAERKYINCAFEAVTVENADVAGFNILDEGTQAVLDMSSYPSVEEACLVVIGIIKGLFDWAEQYEDERVLCHVYLDEAQRFLPQTLEDSILQDKTVRQALLKAYMDVIAVGGKRGLSPVILTQRFAQVNKKIMAQSEVFFLMKQTNERDLDRCMEYVNRKSATEEQISTFIAGQGIYIAATGEQFVTRFLPRESDGARGSTPTVEAAERYATRPRIVQDQSQGPTNSAANSKNYADSGFLGRDSGPVPAQTESIINPHERLVPEAPVESSRTVPSLGPEDRAFTAEQEQDFLHRFKKAQDVKACLRQMTNNRGEIGLSNRYYKYAKWLADTQGLVQR